MTTLFGKVEADVEIKASPEKFHEILSGRPHHISNVCLDKIQDCALHEGDWGTEGSVIYWDYVHGKPISITHDHRLFQSDNDQNSNLE
jgi:hypothetical protein